MAMPPETMPKVVACERQRSAAKSYFVCCVHGVGLLLCCEIRKMIRETESGAKEHSWKKKS